jgi:hypothetical protein
MHKKAIKEYNRLRIEFTYLPSISKCILANINFPKMITKSLSNDLISLKNLPSLNAIKTHTKYKSCQKTKMNSDNAYFLKMKNGTNRCYCNVVVQSFLYLGNDFFEIVCII